MWQQLGQGAAVGAVVAWLCALGNRTPHVVSIFPDALTILALAVLLNLAIWFDRGRRANNRAARLSAGLTISVAAGVVFGSAVVMLGRQRLLDSSLPVSAFGFLTALGAALAFGVVASLIPGTRPIRTSTDP